MPFSLRPSRVTIAALLFAGGAMLAGCTIGGRGAQPQPSQAAAPSEQVQEPVLVTPIPSAPSPANAVGLGKIPVALLLPLSGPNAAVGQAMLDAAQMALFDVGDDKLTLVVRDSGGTGASAAAAAQSALAGGARLIIGPLLAPEVEAVKPVAQGANVAMIAFSTATQLAGNGTWLLGFDPRQEIERVVRYAHAHGRDRFAALAPQGLYGDIAVAALRDSTQLAGASIGRIARYDPASPNPTAAVQNFAQGANGMDAALLPEGGAKLKAIAAQLPYYGADPDKVKFLGTGLWADATIGTEPALEGGWYASPAPQVRRDFEKRFAALYNHPAPLLATLGYDATALAAVLARAPNADFSAASLTNPSGFSGLNGIFRLLPDGIVERGLAVLEVHRTGATVIDPAPQTFQRPGS